MVSGTENHLRKQIFVINLFNFDQKLRTLGRSCSPGVISGEANENGFINLADGSEISLTKGNKIEHLSSEGNTGNCNSSNQGFYLIISNPKLPNKYITFNSCFDYKIQVTELNEQDLTSSVSTDSTTTPTDTTVTTPTETVSSPTTAPDIVTIISKKNYKNNKNK